jgi:hypothetical protein
LLNPEGCDLAFWVQDMPKVHWLDWQIAGDFIGSDGLAIPLNDIERLPVSHNSMLDKALSQGFEVISVLSGEIAGS